MKALIGLFGVLLFTATQSFAFDFGTYVTSNTNISLTEGTATVDGTGQVYNYPVTPQLPVSGHGFDFSVQGIANTNPFTLNAAVSLSSEAAAMSITIPIAGDDSVFSGKVWVVDVVDNYPFKDSLVNNASSVGQTELTGQMSSDMFANMALLSGANLAQGDGTASSTASLETTGVKIPFKWGAPVQQYPVLDYTGTSAVDGAEFIFSHQFNLVFPGN